MLRDVYINMDSYSTSREARAAAQRDKSTDPGIASQIGADIGAMGRDAPRGYYELLKAGALDTRDYWWNPEPGKTQFPRTRRLGGGLLQSLAEDIRHPLRHPGYTAMDLAVGAGTAVKIPAALGRAARVARAVEPKHLLKPPPREPGGPSQGRRLAEAYGRAALKIVPTPKNVEADLALIRSGSARKRAIEAKAAALKAATRPTGRRSGR